MKSLKLKTTCHGNHVHVELAHPQAQPGDIRDASIQIRQVNNIPESVDHHEVVRLFSGTCDMSPFAARRLEFDFSELGVGRIVK